MELTTEVLLHLCSKMDDSSLRSLSKTIIWLQIREFSSDQLFWKMRTEFILRRDLSLVLGTGWKEAYYFFNEGSLFSIPNKLVVRLLDLMEIDLSTSDNLMIRSSARDGNSEVVRILLAYAVSCER